MVNNFKSLQLNLSYTSYGDNSIVDGLLLPALKITKTYKRSVGFFSSSVLRSISNGLKGLVENNGTIQIIASPKLNQEDIDIINQSYSLRESIVEKNIKESLKFSLENIPDEERLYLSELIVSSVLDIKIVVSKSNGIYHDKLGLLTDNFGNKIVFVGSSNETESGLELNYEKIRVFRSWNYEDNERVKDEEKEFDKLWENDHQHLTVYKFKEAIQSVAFEVINEIKRMKRPKTSYVLRPYQNLAVKSWVDNGYNGFFVMATGTGKTITALFAIKTLVEKMNVLTIITVPYKHLVSQWFEDVELIFDAFEIIKVVSEISNWQEILTNAIVKNKRSQNNKNIIIISTMASFSLNRFKETVKKHNGEKILVVDEAHRFYNKILSGIDFDDYKFRLGLSATPVFGKNIEKAKNLLSFFGGKVYELTIDDAIGKFLVNYEYKPIFVKSSSEDEIKFKKISIQMRQCFDKNGKLIDPEKFIELHRARLRVISMVESKTAALKDILMEMKLKDHFIVYCGDGKVYETAESELRHLDSIKKILNQFEYRPSQFTASESMKERIELIKLFDSGEISSLVAIKCLDEGINIPSIQTAIIMSSNDDYREFVQRRGRILRKDGIKNTALIIDFVVLPSIDTPEIAKIELRRFNEYSRLALNFQELKPSLNELMLNYEIDYSEIDYDDILEQIEGVELND
jgi:superfamily II DNA or RNA helicase